MYLPRGSGSTTFLATLPADSIDVPMDAILIRGKRLCLANRQQKIYCRKGDSWVGFGDRPGRAIAVDGSEAVWLVTKAGEIYRHMDSKVDIFWQKMPGSAGAQIAAGGDQVWLINTAGLIYRWQNLRWVQMPGSSGKRIHVTHDGKEVTLNNTAGLVYRWNGSSWDRLRGDF